MTLFEKIYFDFVKSPYWHQMLNTCENSPHHREANVAEHTRMALSWYDNNLKSGRTKDQQLLTKLAILFHDVSKPISRNEKPDGTCNYGGHEVTSANVFVYYFETLGKKFQLNSSIILAVRWMIENHLPYNLVAKEKLSALRASANFYLSGDLQIFGDLLKSDAAGRISDNPRFSKTLDWISTSLYKEHHEFSEPKKIAYILIGPSGSGKSTFTSQLIENSDRETNVFSLDECREKFYHTHNTQSDNYADFWNYANDNADNFGKFVNLELFKTIRNNSDVVIDNTNLSPKRRRQWITNLKQRDYHIVGVLFTTPLETCVTRRSETLNKIIPRSVIESHFYKMQLPRFGYEIDELILK